MEGTMKGAILPGNSTAELREFPIPTPGHGEVLIKTKSSTICGSDIHAIYHAHYAEGPKGIPAGTIAGHEPCGQIVEAGSGCRRFRVGDRVIVYHISGCGVCYDCRQGYMITCTNDDYHRAYGWQRHGGMAEYILAEEKDLVPLPDVMTYSDGAQVACGFGTVYEGLEKIGLCGNDAVLIAGLGPVGLAAGMLCKAMGATQIIGTEIIDERIKIAESLGLFDVVLKAGPENVQQVKDLTGGMGVEKAVDCSGEHDARLTAIQATRRWGKIVLIGEGSTVEFQPSQDLMHDQKTIIGSWVTSIWRLEDLVERLVRWNIHPERLITHWFSLDEVDAAYALMASQKCGKVAICFDEELK